MKHRYPTLAEYLRRSGVTQEALAERLGVSQSVISRAANYGQGSFKLLKRIAAATGVPLESFDRKDAA
jgi:transcriptional regulator with XRE-family HTH domain